MRLYECFNDCKVPFSQKLNMLLNEYLEKCDNQ